MVFCIIWIDDSETFGNSFCCILVVTCDHDWTNTRFLSDTNSFCSFWTLRVNHADQTREDKVRLNNFRFQGWNFMACLISHHQDTKGLFGQIFVGSKDSFLVFICNWTNFPIDFNTSHALEQLVRSTLNSDKVRTVCFFVDGRHELTIRIKWQFRHTWLALQDFTNIKVVIQTKLYQSSLCWVPNQLARWIHFSVIGKVHDTKGIVASSNFCCCTLQLTVGIDFFNRHLVHGQGTCFIRCDDFCRTKCFNCWQFTND